MSPRCAQKLARLQTIVAERAAWASPLAQVKRMQGWVLDIEHILDGSWAQPGEVVSNAAVGSRLDGWRKQMAQQLTDGTFSELERECLTECLQVLTNEASVSGAVLRPQRLSSDQQRDGALYSRPQDAVSPHQRSQELERLFVALWALCGVCGLVGARCGSSPALGAARWPTRPRSLARTATGDHRSPG